MNKLIDYKLSNLLSSISQNNMDFITTDNNKIDIWALYYDIEAQTYFPPGSLRWKIKNLIEIYIYNGYI